ncbi:hypothetical protein [Bradyrhizobium sp. SYSU BS000235]|uniref:hypothetical protein n=1 Tax=Bradyrhizobium sp. SYSU BS000235 TaxID=3411332 RepID=UPI003C748162
MFRTGLVAFLAVVLPAAASAYEIKPKSPETAFSGKLQPDIVGLSTATEGSKAASVFEAYLKDLPGVKPEPTLQKFGRTNVTYVTSMKFTSPASGNRAGESMLVAFSSPASANRAYYVSRTLGFANDKQLTKSDMIQQVMAKYGDKPTAIGDGRLYYFYKGGKIASVKQKYNPASALEALNAPINPKAAIALNDANGRGSCVAMFKHAQASDKSLGKLLDDAKAANCDGLLTVELSSGVAQDRVGKAEFTLIDFKQIVSSAKIDAEAFAAEKDAAVHSTTPSNAPKL